MAEIVKGTLYYQQNSFAGILNSRIEIVTDCGQYIEPTNKVKGICIILYNINTFKALNISTSNTGTFEFTNVPNGEYYLIKTAGITTQFTTGVPINFSNAKNIISKPQAEDPKIDIIKNQG